MQIAMLGPLEVRRDGDEVLAVSGARLRQLLIALALHPRRMVTAGYLVGALWGEDPPADPANAVQALVSRLRRALPGIEVSSRSAGYLLDVDPDAVDVRRFERLVTAGRSLAPTAPEEAAATLRAALALWRGPALADAAGAEFARATVARLDELRLVAVQERIDAELRCGPPGALVAELEGLVADHPLREPLVKLLIRALHAGGDRGRALAVFELARNRLADELGVAPGADLAAEHVRILRADEATPAAAPGAALAREQTAETGAPDPSGTPGEPPPAPARPTNLRADISSFVGRERDLAGINALLASSRLATLTGPGGAGKTRLAMHAARDRADAMPDGAWMVELAPISDPADLVPAVLAVLGVRDRSVVRAGGTGIPDPVVDPLERLLSALARRRSLLVLDNCEHLIDPAARLADTILGACPDVRILATSREPLGVTGEALWPVEPLGLPAPGESVPPGELAGYPAVRLLVQRAALVRPGFSVTEANAGAVLRICRALDGMPLAIELAAARLRAMTPEQLAARLDDRFAVLTGGSRTALPRHQTLRAVVDWSWDLLDEAERALLRRLSVFTGGARLAAVEAVCAGEGLAPERVLDALAGLVDKSLVAVRDDRPEPRYHLLETIRAYGQMRLDEAGERERLRAAHAAHFVAFAVGARLQLISGAQVERLAEITADHDNFTAALRGAVAAGEADRAVTLAASLAWYWWLRGHRVEGAELCSSALAAAQAQDPDGTGVDPEEMALAYSMGAMLIVDGTGDAGRAMEWFEAAVAQVHRAGTPRLAWLRIVEPLYHAFRSFETGAPFVPEVEMPVEDPEPWVSGIARVMRAHIQLNFGRSHAEAELDFHRALAVFRTLRERWGTAFTLNSLATLAGWRGDFGTAVAHTEEALRCVVELGAPEDEVEFRLRQAQLLWVDGQRGRAHGELGVADRAARRLGVPHVLSRVAYVAGDIARLEGDLVLAAQQLRRAEELMPDGTAASQYRSIVASSIGYLEAARGDADEARRQHRRAVELAVSSFDAPVVAQAVVGLAEVTLDEGDAQLAATLLGAGAGIRGRPDLSFVDSVRVAARTEAALGTVAFEQAYQRGLRATSVQIGELVGVPFPKIEALTTHA